MIEVARTRDLAVIVIASLSISPFFSPQTAKVKASGRAYPDTTRASSGPIGVSIPTIGRRLPIEYRLQMTGAEVADRVLSNLSIPLPKE
ncbi:MAG: hypothetical protein WKF84_17205 [Pyrinomonadaceae bacterium]